MDSRITGVIQSSVSMTADPEIRARFAQETSQADEHINLARAALLIAHEEYLDLNVDAYLNVLDEMAGNLESCVDPSYDLLTMINRRLDQYSMAHGDPEKLPPAVSDG